MRFVSKEKYNAEFPTVDELKNELTNKRFFGEIIREGQEIKYSGEMQIIYDDSDRVEISLPLAEAYEKQGLIINLPDNSRYYIEGKEIGCERGDPITSNIHGSISVDFRPFDYTWCGANPPKNFPKGTVFQICFTNLLINDFWSAPRFRIGTLYFKFKQTKEDIWKTAMESKEGKITNVAIAKATGETTLEELRDVLFSIDILFEIASSNRIRTPIVKFILPNSEEGFMLFHQSSGIPAINHFRMWHRLYTPELYVLSFFSKAAKLVHEKRNDWNLTHFAESLIASNQGHIERRLINIILALETIHTGYVLDAALSNQKQIESGINLQSKIFQSLNALNKSQVVNKKVFTEYFEISKLSEYRNMLFHQGKLPDYDNVLGASDLSFKWLELAWFMFLNMCSFRCTFNKPPVNHELNYMLAECENCKIKKCNLKRKPKK